ncbi:HdeD family acid-resistance protein [Primorskyibacter flagellatus]|uniref:HdeD family acid-resistance protein n=1 Tax=Primorskyibacter flagellatus TaxID=1387277 RepID=UPI003A93D15C
MQDYMSFPERNWWLLLVRGSAALLFGVAAFAWPGLTVAVLVLIFGAYVLIDGILGVVDSIRYRDRLDRWWLWLLDGMLGVAVGAMMLFMPGISVFVLLMFIAGWAIAGGVLRIIAVIQLRREIEGEWLLGLGGVLSILFGGLLIAMPGAGLVSLVWLIGIWALVFGGLFIMLAFRLRTLGEDRPAPAETK